MLILFFGKYLSEQMNFGYELQTNNTLLISEPHLKIMERTIFDSEDIDL